MPTPIAIDFGTSNSAVGTIKDGKPHLIQIEGNNATIPSAIFFDTEDNVTRFGNEAVSYYIEGCEGRLLRSLKSILGSSLIDDATLVDNRNIKFRDIIAIFVKYLKNEAEKVTGQRAQDVVLGRPVRFVDHDDKADIFAQDSLELIAKQVGFKNVEFQYEPIAAALDYEQSVQKEELALIVDIGGGTSDFSIVRVSPDRREKNDRKEDILANTGVHVGGTDFDRVLSLEQVMPLLGHKSRIQAMYDDETLLEMPSSLYHKLATWHEIVFLYNYKTLQSAKELLYRSENPELIKRLVKVLDKQEGHRLASDIEKAKIHLSDDSQASFFLDYAEQGLKAHVFRDKFEEDLKRETRKIVLHIKECVKQAGVSFGDITTLFMTGGSSSIPLVANACKNTVPNALLVKGDKFGSVTAGLALDSRKKFGNEKRRNLV